jgi:poly(3-hydroxybutyrate) depolymerase
VHGLSDGTCPISSGRSSVNRFVENNGCTGNATEATPGGSHVSYDYECDDAYPVKWCTFDGGHMDQPVDPGQSSTWVPQETWDFITQF